MKDATKDFNEKVNEKKGTENLIHFKSIDLSKPHITNLNEDP